MSIQPQHGYTLEEYCALEQASEIRYEYWQGDVFAMSDASPAHAQIQVNLITLLRVQLRGGPCRVFPSDIRLKVPSLPLPTATPICPRSVASQCLS